MTPASGVTAPLSTFIKVDLPAPFSPMRACTSPGRSSRSTPRSACVEPKRLLMPRIVKRAADMACPPASLLLELGQLELALLLERRLEELPRGLGLEVVFRQQVFAGAEGLAGSSVCTRAADVVAFEVLHHRPDAQVAHAVGVLD